MHTELASFEAQAADGRAAIISSGQPCAVCPVSRCSRRSLPHVGAAGEDGRQALLRLGRERGLTPLHAPLRGLLARRADVRFATQTQLRSTCAFPGPHRRSGVLGIKCITLSHELAPLDQCNVH